MTNIQAIELLKGLEQSLDDYCELNDEGKNAFRMAITALEVFGNSEQLPYAQPQYTELTPEEAASEIASGSTMSAYYWLDDMIRIKQMGYAICRKR